MVTSGCGIPFVLAAVNVNCQVLPVASTFLDMIHKCTAIGVFLSTSDLCVNTCVVL